MYFDTHAHYDDAAFNADREALLASLPERGVDLVIDGNLVHDGEVEVKTVRPVAGFKDRVSLVQIHRQPRIHIFRIIPRHDRRVILLIRPALQKQSDRVVEQDLIAGELRRQI